MANLTWLIRRLKAMSLPEVSWRLSQKLIQKSEKNRFKAQKVSVTSALFNANLKELTIDAGRMYLNLDNSDYSLETSIPLLGDFDYQSYKQQWNAGFQTENVWPDQFSYDLEYRQRDDIGDVRTNWELNRHFQFALLAKDYRATTDKKYLTELEDLFEDWNNKNPFLWGISWTSVMEVAIRCSNWCYAYCFLEGMPCTDKIENELRIGILNMAEYIANHYSRYSSANNHLIVEVYAIGQVGILTNYQPWIELSVQILTREFPIQNYSDGINRELSLHYQSFYMEAVGLMMRLLSKNKLVIPEEWSKWLSKMSKYLRDCIGNYGEVVEFGDNDEGKILDLIGTRFNHYQYVLQLMSCLLNKRYLSEIGTIENINWLFEQEDINAANAKEEYIPENSICYTEGGNTILRSDDQKILIGIDHAALGFGSIAAHGHADALSFQMYLEGIPVFVDPGTYIYQFDLEERNAFRKTVNHNTLCVDGRDQSEMLGAFLWGRKANTKLVDRDMDSAAKFIEAETDGYPESVSRRYEFNKNLLVLTDMSANPDSTVTFNVGPKFELTENGDGQYSMYVDNHMIKITFNGEKEISIDNAFYSADYGKKEEIKALRVKMGADKLITRIEVGEI